MDNQPIRLTHQDPRWRQDFEQARSSVLQSCAGRVISVEHIGGTALPGCISQPVIDMVAAVEDPEDLECATALIEGLFFRRVPATPWASDAFRLLKPRDGSATHQLFLTVIESPFRRGSVQLRDRLLERPEMQIRLEETKVRFWKECQGDPDQYETKKRAAMAHFMDQLGIE